VASETFDILREAVNAGMKGVVKEYLDGRIEACIDKSGVPEGYQPLWTSWWRYAGSFGRLPTRTRLSPWSVSKTSSESSNGYWTTSALI